MVEEDLVEVTEPRQSPKPWRRLGLLVAVVGTIGALVGMTWPHKRLTPMQRMSMMTEDFMSAFAATTLTDMEKLVAGDINWMFVEETATELGGMTIEVALQQKAEGGLDDPELKIVFAAQEGKGEDLGKQLEEVKKAILDEMGEDVPPAAQHLTIVAQADDTVVVKVGAPPLGDAGQTIAEGMEEQAPVFRAKLSTGRTLSEMYANIHKDSFELLPAGVKLSLHTSMAKKILGGVLSIASSANPLVQHSEEQLKALNVIASLSSNTTLRYRKQELAEATDVFPLGKVVEEYANLGSLPPSILKPLKGLQDCSDGVKTIEVRGLPLNWGFVMTFSHFKVSAVLAEMIGDLA